MINSITDTEHVCHSTSNVCALPVDANGKLRNWSIIYFYMVMRTAVLTTTNVVSYRPFDGQRGGLESIAGVSCRAHSGVQQFK